jgi:hypothetical protein
VLTAIALLSGCGPVQVRDAQTHEEQRSVTVAGSGFAEVVPDAVQFSFTVSVLDADGSKALEMVASTMKGLRKVLKDAGIKDVDVRTENVSSGAEYTYNGTGQTLSGYRAVQSTTVMVRDTELAGKVLGELAQVGGNSLQIGAAQPVVSEPTAGTDDARRAAVKDAREKAELYAEELGFELGDVLQVSEPSPGGGPVMFESRMAPSVSSDQAPSIDPGSQKVQVNVEVRWSLR